MAVIPTLLTPTEGTDDQVANVGVIEIRGALTTAANGFYTSNGATPPVFTQVADSAYTIVSTESADQWDILNTSATQYTTTYCPNTSSPITGYVYQGTPLVWSETGGIASNPTSVKLPGIPLLLTP